MEIRLSGAICGHMWMPETMAGLPITASITSERRRTAADSTIAAVINLILAENGGDFQDAAFAADTLIIFEYRKPLENGRIGYTYHRREYELQNCPSLSDYVTQDNWHVADFLSLEEC